MNIFVYSDESGVFDKKHNNYYVYGGLIFLGKDEKDEAVRKYKKAEKVLRKNNYQGIENFELKACKIKNKEKSQLYRSLNKYIQFAIIVNQNNVLDRIFKSKKDKQRYLDYVYKIGVKKVFQTLISAKKIDANAVERLYFFVDEHTTATNGKYELEEGLEKEFKTGTYNFNYNYYYEPIFRELLSLEVKFCNSSTIPLVRGADIVANRAYFHICSGTEDKLENKMIVEFFP